MVDNSAGNPAVCGDAASFSIRGGSVMPAIAFAVPRQEGSDDNAQKLLDELTGEAGEQLHHRRVAHGFRRIRIWHQDAPQNMTIVYLEADDLQKAMANMAADDHDHNQRMGDMIGSALGRHPTDHASRPKSRLVMDWHADKGHSRSHHD
jgi:hypothetical protein